LAAGKITKRRGKGVYGLTGGLSVGVRYKLVGDVDFESASQVAGKITPVSGPSPSPGSLMTNNF
jgi:hypothetical protein